jgi:hypothetical protein
MLSNIIFFVSESLLFAIIAVLIFKLVAKSRVHGKMIIIKHEDGRKTFSLELDQDPELLLGKDSVTFKVVDVEGEKE